MNQLQGTEALDTFRSYGTETQPFRETSLSIPSTYQVLCACPFFFGASFSLERDNSVLCGRRKDKYTEIGTNV